MAGTAAKYKNTGKVTSAQFRTIKYVGKTKGGQSVTIELENAFCISNLDWTVVEKDDVVSALEFEACYTDGAADPYLVPSSITIDGEPATAADGILLGVGAFYVGETLIALTRGGGQYTEEQEIREINADGDRGKVMGRVTNESVRAKLKMNVLTFIKGFATIFPQYAVQA